MKWIEILQKDNYALLQSESDTQYAVVSGYDPTQHEDQQWSSGIYFTYFQNNLKKILYLQSAYDCFMQDHMISESEYEEYCRLKEKDSPKLKKRVNYRKYCPVCGYLVDDLVPPQKYCDRCGQRLCTSLFEI